MGAVEEGRRVGSGVTLGRTTGEPIAAVTRFAKRQLHLPGDDNFTSPPETAL